MDLTGEGQSATIENIRNKLEIRFPHMTAPSASVVYDTLAQLMHEQKIYQTSKGYFILTPERRRSRSRPRNQHNGYIKYSEEETMTNLALPKSRTILMTNAEALHSLYGEILTERDGDLTHQCIQTNLADVICGGNPNDKIMYPRVSKRRSSSFPTPRSLERRHSMRIFGSSKRLQRCSSTRSLSKTYAQTLNTDSSSSEYQSTDSSSPKKGSLLFRLFHRSGRNKSRQLETYSAQFPPAEWFNSKTVHLHSVGTQTMDHDIPVVHELSNSIFYDGSELSHRSLTLPRRHRRHLSSESAFLISSRDASPIRLRSPIYDSGSLPRSTQSIPITSNSKSYNNSSIGSINNFPANRKNHNCTRMSTTMMAKYQSVQKSLNNGQINASVSRNVYERSPAPCRKSYKTTLNVASRYVDNKCEYRGVASGPSSLESTKTSIFTSGPSSIDSSKISYHRTSGHSSLDSQRSSSTMIVHPNHPNQTRAIITLNGSPRSTTRHQMLRKLNTDHLSNVTSNIHHNEDHKSITSSINMNQILTGATNSDNVTYRENSENNCSSISTSTSNNSITLKVTTSTDGQIVMPNTKIVVQNTPAQSVITFENSQLADNSNIYIFNNETMTNERGEILRKTLSKDETISTSNYTRPLITSKFTTVPSSISKPLAKSSSILLATDKNETCTSINREQNNDIRANSYSSHVNSQCNSSMILPATSVNNNLTMNNSREISTAESVLVGNEGVDIDVDIRSCISRGMSAEGTKFLYKNNVLKNEEFEVDEKNSSVNLVCSPCIKSNNDTSVCGDNNSGSETPCNLRCFEKTLNEYLIRKGRNNMRYESTNNLAIRKENFRIINKDDNIKTTVRSKIIQEKTPINVAVNMSGNHLVNMLQKNNIGSQPNLSLNDNNNCMSMVESIKSVEKESLKRRFSIASTKENNDTSEELFNFPSLTDLSFNFTSLAAQKILQGVSLNSIDTLVELNMAAAAAAVTAVVEKPTSQKQQLATSVMSTND